MKLLLIITPLLLFSHNAYSCRFHGDNSYGMDNYGNFYFQPQSPNSLAESPEKYRVNQNKEKNPKALKKKPKSFFNFKKQKSSTENSDKNHESKEASTIYSNSPVKKTKNNKTQN